MPTIIIYYIVVVEMIQEMSSEIFQTYVSKIKDQNNLVTDSYIILIILFLDREFL